jgi:predicted MPP superfamily phosphohydrolase
MRRILTAAVFFCIFIFPLFYYLGWSLGSVYGWVLLSIVFALVLSFPFVRHGPSLVQVTFLSMGLLSYLIVFCLLKDLLSLFGIHLPVEVTYALAFLSVVFGTLVAWRGPKVVCLKLAVNDLAPELEGFKIVQISDLHVGPTIGKKYVEKVVATCNDLKPDLLAMTGDIGDGPVDRYREAIAPIGKLRAQYGVFYVPGNHEYYWNANEWMNVMNNLKAIVLLNRAKKIQVKGKDVLVGGVADPAGVPGPDPKLVFQAAEKSVFKILLSHRPGLALEAAAIGFDLQLSGHTHGGQFFPWTVLVRFFHKHFLGHYRIGKMWLNVNSGTGSWGPFLRLGTTSEITLIELIASHKSLE